MRDMDVLNIYKRFANLFHLECSLGRVYKIDPEMVKRPQYGTPADTVYYNGDYYSYNYYPNSEVVHFPDLKLVKAFVTKQFSLKLEKTGFKFKGKYRVYDTSREIETPCTDIFRTFEGFEFRITTVGDDIFLVIDPKVVTVVEASIQDFIDKGANIDALRDFSVHYPEHNEGNQILKKGYLISTILRGQDATCVIRRYSDFEEVEVPAKDVIPEARPELLQMLLSEIGREFDIIKHLRKHTFLDSKTSSLDRLSKTLDIVNDLVSRVFPLKFGEFEVKLSKSPAVIREVVE